MSDTLTYAVSRISCEHCRTAITTELSRVAGIDSVGVDLENKLVQVRGEGVDDDAVVAAIDAAGYDAIRA